MTRTTHNQLWTLLGNELGVGQVSRWEFVLALCFFYLPWLALNIGMHAVGEDLTAIHPGQLGVGILFWLMGACFLASYAQVPLVYPITPQFKPFEFLFTRAVDRRLNFRVKALAALLFLVVPQVPGWVLAAGMGDSVVTFDELRSPEGPAVVRTVNTVQRGNFPTERYLRAFPGSERLGPEKPGGHERFRIHNGWRMYSAWVTCFTILLGALIFDYFALLGPWLRCPGWGANTLLAAPLPILMGAIFWPALRGINPGDETFLFFAEHWLACGLVVIVICALSLRWCERRFCQLEVE